MVSVLVPAPTYLTLLRSVPFALFTSRSYKPSLIFLRAQRGVVCPFYRVTKPLGINASAWIIPFPFYLHLLSSKKATVDVRANHGSHVELKKHLQHHIIYQLTA